MAGYEKQHIAEPDMVCLNEDDQTICTIHDKTPGSNQKKISIIVRPNHTVAKVFSDIKIQFSYDNFELLLQPSNKEESIYLNDKQDIIFYKLPGFVPKIKNILILSPPGSFLSTSSELSSVTIQSKIKLSSSLAKQKLKSNNTNINDSLDTSTKNNSSLAISNGCAVHIIKENNVVENSINFSKQSIEKNSELVNISETLNKISAAITEQSNMPVPIVSDTTSDCTNKANASFIQTEISNREIENTKEKDTKPNDVLSKSSSTKKIIIKKKIVTSTGSEVNSDVDNKSITSLPGDIELKKSPSPKKIVIKKKISTLSENSAESLKNKSASEIDDKKEIKAKSPVKKIVKKVVVKKTATSKTSNECVDQSETICSESQTTSFKKSPSPKKQVKTTSSSKGSATTIEIDVSKNTKTIDGENENDKKEKKKVSSIIELTPETKLIDEGKEAKKTIITLTSKKVSTKFDSKAEINHSTEKNKEDNLENKNSILKPKKPKSLVSNLEADSMKINSVAKVVKNKTSELNETENPINSVLKEEMDNKETTNTSKITSKAEENKNIKINHQINIDLIQLDEPEDSHRLTKSYIKNIKSAESCSILDQEPNLECTSSKTILDNKITTNTTNKEPEIFNLQSSDIIFSNNLVKQTIVDLDVNTKIFPNAVDNFSLKNLTSTENLDNTTKHLDAKVHSKNNYSDLLSDDYLPVNPAVPVEHEITETSINVPTPPALPMFKPIESMPSTSGSGKFDKEGRFATNRPANCGYVGLVNQAMTCYLNSLLQALYMTPEFRNALYKREFDNCKDDIIPYQLQRLFLNLQTSSKNAVETTDLTKSFGWDSTEAWQQHDIQELCRVMFDALEHKFKNTDQANLINILYEGKMFDYVKCLECNTEKSREDTFLDIPLPVRPFGSVAAYGSIEEALRAFVQPETLDGNNQYFCEKCNKKCDAHKGLKFKKFPYILTLHLKRFDFDYQTLHRIKLNDKVTFPQTLNLSSFVRDSNSGSFFNFSSNNHINGFAQTDDSSTTDSGAVLEEDNSSGIATTASSSHHENELQEDDEGIDAGNTIDNQCTLKIESDKFMYELFAIMIHSGSASGGHYYAYIKEFENGEWFCFNDQTVTSITQEDIQKSFGGGSFKSYYSSMYSTSTNAYMLMYRQIDPKRNEKCIKTEEFPDHVNKLLERMKTDEETKRSNRNFDVSDIVRQKVYFYNPLFKKMKDAKIYVPRDFNLDSALDSAYCALKVSFIAPMERCRLVAYDHNLEEIECSFEDRDKEEFGDILKSLPADIDFLLEIRDADSEFEAYKSGGVTVKVFIVDTKTEDLNGPFSIRVYENEKVGGLKKRIAQKLKIDEEIFVSIKNYYTGEKVYVTQSNNGFIKTEIEFKKFVESQYSSVNCFFITIPEVKNKNLEVLGIPYTVEEMKLAITPRQSPSLDRRNLNDCGVDVCDAVMLNGGPSSYNELNNCISNSSGIDCSYGTSNVIGGRSSPPQISISQGSSTGSNSEDSSLSDGDRTLVESNQHDSSQVSSASNSPQLSSPDDDNLIPNKIDNIIYPDKLSLNKSKERHIISHEILSDDEEIMNLDTNSYFRAYKISSDLEIKSNNLNSITTNSLDSEKNGEDHIEPINLKVFADKYMKIGSLKRALEPFINVSAEYFKIFKIQSEILKNETPKNQEDLTVFKDGDQLSVEVCREAKRDERKAKIYFMRRKELNNETGKFLPICEFVFKIGLTVIEAKKKLVTQLHRIDPKLYQTLTLENCRLWEKTGRNPIKILPNNYKLGDMKMFSNCEFLIQECEEGIKSTTSETSLTLFVRRWYPSRYELGEYEEITLEKDSEIRCQLSSLSKIPEENISFAKANTTSFPYNNISLLTMHTAVTWINESMSIDNYFLSTSLCGSVFFYKDNTEELKELSAEERKELSTREKIRMDRVGGTTRSLYSPRRERALKIYLDSPPKSCRDD